MTRHNDRYPALPGTHVLTQNERIAVFKEFKRNPNVSAERLAKYWDTSVKQIEKILKIARLIGWK